MTGQFTLANKNMSAPFICAGTGSQQLCEIAGAVYFGADNIYGPVQCILEQTAFIYLCSVFFLCNKVPLSQCMRSQAESRHQHKSRQLFLRQAHLQKKHKPLILLLIVNLAETHFKKISLSSEY